MTRGWPASVLTLIPRSLQTRLLGGREQRHSEGLSGHTLQFLCPLQSRLAQSHFLRELPLIFPLIRPHAPPRATKAARDVEKGAFDPVAHEWQKPGEGRRRGSHSEE